MKGILLDTNALLWLLDESHRLGPNATELLRGGTPVHYSAASVWEIEIKRMKGRLTIAGSLSDGLARSRLDELAVTSEHAHAIDSVHVANNDPFDRMILTQATVAGLTLITADRALLGLGRPDVVDARA